MQYTMSLTTIPHSSYIHRLLTAPLDEIDFREKLNAVIVQAPKVFEYAKCEDRQLCPDSYSWDTK